MAKPRLPVKEMRVYWNSESSTHSFSSANLRDIFTIGSEDQQPTGKTRRKRKSCSLTTFDGHLSILHLSLANHLLQQTVFKTLQCPSCLSPWPVAGMTCFRLLHQDFSTKGLLHPLSGRYCEDKDGLYFQSVYWPFRPEIYRIIGWLSGPLFPFGQKWAIFQEKNPQLRGKEKGGGLYI